MVLAGWWVELGRVQQGESGGENKEKAQESVLGSGGEGRGSEQVEIPHLT